MNIQDAKTAFLKMYPNELTNKSYGKDISKFIKYFNLVEAKEIENIMPSQWRDNIDYMLTVLIDSSVNSYIRSIHSFMSFLKSDEIIEKEYITKTKLGTRTIYVKETEKEKVIITDKEFVAMFKAGNIEDKAMLAILRYIGARRDELVNVKVEDVDLENMSFNINFGKNSRRRILGFTETVKNVISDYINWKKLEKGDYLFVGKSGRKKNEKLDGQAINARVKSLARKAGIEEERVDKITAHKFRGTLITEYARENIELGRQVAGHSNLQTTLLYVKAGMAPDIMRKHETTMLDGLYVAENTENS